MSKKAYDDDSSSSNNKSDYNNSFIDHRQYNDLAHIHSSPARTRRRNSQFTSPFTYGKRNDEHLPLTNKNLQNFNSTSGSASPTTQTFGAVAIDMDRYAREQSQYALPDPFAGENEPEAKDHRRRRSKVHHHGHSVSHGHNMSASFGNNFRPSGENHSYDEGDNYSVNSLEFGASNPSSEHSSDSTSLDDVCFPDYYAEAPEATSAEWPDLKVLREFIDAELEELNENLHEEANFPNLKPASGLDHVNFKFNPPHVESNEIESASSKSKHSFRITPRPIHPGDKPSTELMATAPILNKSKVKEDVCRFTYFRDDLTKTIHSPTLSGLLMNTAHTKVKEQPTNLNKKWHDNNKEEHDNDEEILNVEDLFQPLFYSNGVNLSHQALRQFHSPSGIATPNVHAEGGNSGAGGGANNGTGAGASSGTAGVNYGAGGVSSGAATPNEPLKNVVNRTGLTGAGGTPSVAGVGSTTDKTPAGTITDSIDPEVVNPFWLDVLDPTEEEMKVLSKTFGIHPLTTEDIFLGEAREKVELFKSYYFICFTSFDVVYERRKQRIREQERKLTKLQELNELNEEQANIFRKIFNKFSNQPEEMSLNLSKSSSSRKSAGKKIREGELSPLSMYMIVFKHGVITFHFSATPHPINVRRRIRLLKDYLTVSSDWISYALIDDITDSFAPMIESIEEEVNSIEEAILRMHAGDNDSDSEEEDSEDEVEDKKYGSTDEGNGRPGSRTGDKKENIFFKRPRSKSVVDKNGYRLLDGPRTKTTSQTSSSRSKSYSKILGWKRKGDMLRRIGECRKRVMSVLRLLGSKADVIKGFSKRLNETELSTSRKLGPQSRLEISMYLGDIQDHIITMVQLLNHYEKLLARFHSNYLAQINIDMTKVNNDTNDVLGKITILGTIVLPINVVTGLWGMNCLVPGQDYDGLAWFWSIIGCMVAFSIFAYNYAKRAYGI